MKEYWYGYVSDFLTPKEPDIRYMDVREEPFEIHGIFELAKDNFYRLPLTFAKTVSEDVTKQMRAGAGVRVRFATDSPYVAIRAKLEGFCEQPHITFVAEKGFDLYTVENGKFKFHNVFYPPLDLENEVTGITRFSGEGKRDIVLNLPTGTAVLDLQIGVKSGSFVGKPASYENEKPVVFYGSSITQGFAASRPGTSYINFLSREQNMDYINLGFAGSALGEEAMAKYIAAIPMSMFVMDYDHNAPNVRHLQATHDAFYQIIREKNPDLPVIFVTRPEPSGSEDTLMRNSVIYKTYRKAKENGEKVAFIGGGAFFPAEIQFDCTADWCHPNDMGMYYMAQGIGKVLSQF